MQDRHLELDDAGGKQESAAKGSSKTPTKTPCNNLTTESKDGRIRKQKQEAGETELRGISPFPLAGCRSKSNMLGIGRLGSEVVM